MLQPRVIAVCLGSFLLGGLAVFCARPATGEGKSTESTVVYELRTYTTHPGKLPDLHTRFHDHTMRLFEKHGMTNVIYWTPTDDERKDNTLVYVLKHESPEAAKTSWDGFRNDPEWKKAFAASHKDGPIVSKVETQFLKTTDYSPHR